MDSRPECCDRGPAAAPTRPNNPQKRGVIGARSIDSRLLAACRSSTTRAIGRRGGVAAGEARATALDWAAPKASRIDPPPKFETDGDRGWMLAGVDVGVSVSRTEQQPRARRASLSVKNASECHPSKKAGPAPLRAFAAPTNHPSCASEAPKPAMRCRRPPPDALDGPCDGTHPMPSPHPDEFIDGFDRPGSSSISWNGTPPRSTRSHHQQQPHQRRLLGYA